MNKTHSIRCVSGQGGRSKEGGLKTQINHLENILSTGLKKAMTFSLDVN